MRKVKFHNDENEMYMQKKKTHCHGITTNIKNPNS